MKRRRWSLWHRPDCRIGTAAPRRGRKGPASGRIRTHALRVRPELLEERTLLAGAGSPAPEVIGIGPNSTSWDGFVQPQFSETYTFSFRDDDAARIFINNQLLID